LNTLLNIESAFFVPESLEPRDDSFVIILTGISALSFLLIGLARFYNNKSIQTVFGVYLKQEGVEQILKENLRLNSLSSLALNLSFFIGAGLCVFLVSYQFFELNWYVSLFFGSVFPFIYFCIEVFGILLSAWISGESQKMEGTITNIIVPNAVYGVLFSFLALLWIMNPEKMPLFSISFFILFTLKIVIRIIKNALLVFNKGISWYYIILYFCTLEVLPLLVLYYFVTERFLGKLSWI
jgi:hypothetical protein